MYLNINKMLFWWGKKGGRVKEKNVRSKYDAMFAHRYIMAK